MPLILVSKFTTSSSQDNETARVAGRTLSFPSFVGFKTIKASKAAFLLSDLYFLNI
jgi:hypothetical protein